METRLKVSGGSKPLKKSNRGGQTAARTPKISDFSTCKAQGNWHEIRIAFFERENIYKAKVKWSSKLSFFVWLLNLETKLWSQFDFLWLKREQLETDLFSRFNRENETFWIPFRVAFSFTKLIPRAFSAFKIMADRSHDTLEKAAEIRFSARQCFLHARPLTWKWNHNPNSGQERK